MLFRPSSRRAVQALRSVVRQASHRTPKTRPACSTTPTRRLLSSTCDSSNPRLTRTFYLSATFRKGLSPESPDPEPKTGLGSEHVAQPAPISTEDYHKLADEYIEGLVRKLEQMQEEKGDMDCEYSAGVLNISFPPTGTYVLNKQPPNKQIWLSSPTSGPKRFDWVVSGESQGEKEGGGSGDWIYLRDGTRLAELLRKELGVDMSVDHEAPV